nr:MAG TPA: hypothetical protein [Bacteriophage sp.]
MITEKQLDYFLSRLDLFFNTDQILITEDSIETVDPDLEYKNVEEAIKKVVLYNKNIIDNSLTYVIVRLSDIINGYKVVLDYRVSIGKDGFGTSIKISVYKVFAFINGELKEFNSFKSMNAYADLVSEG